MFTPTGNQILFAPDTETEQRSAGGLHIPMALHDQHGSKGTAVAVGPGLRSVMDGRQIPVDVVAGDVLFIRPKSGFEITLEGKSYRVVSFGDVLGVV